MEIHITLTPPAKCEINDLYEFEQVILSGGQVQSMGLMNRINEAFILAFAKVENKIVSTAALKLPRSSYKKRVFEKAGVIQLSSQHKIELGWVVTLPDYEGNKIGQSLMQALISEYGTEMIYATTKNNVIRHILTKFNFKNAGVDYINRANEVLSLYVLKGSEEVA